MSANASPLKQPARLVIVDDHPMLRLGLRRLLEEQSDLVCCGEAGTVREAEAVAAQSKPDLVILDLRLKDGDGLELIKSLRVQNHRVLVLSQYNDPTYIERALRAGAEGYVVKDQAAREILDAIRTVLAGEIYLTRGVAAHLLHQFVGSRQKTGDTGVALLTDRELHVLNLLGMGRSTRAIATELNVSFKTIESHRENIKHKLGLHDAAALVHYAAEWARKPISLPAEMNSSHP